MNTHICLIDNYDSFTYNLHQLATALGARVTVIRNDQFQPEELSDFDKLLLSPGPVYLPKPDVSWTPSACGQDASQSSAYALANKP